MSDSQAYEEVTVTAHGVTVVKRFEEDEFPVPAIAFEFTSERDEDVTVRLVDSVPDAVAVEDLGFHPEYGSEFWTIDDDQITFERDLDADSEYTTVYGIRATGTDEVEKFLTRPEITDVDPPLPEEEVAANDGGDDVVPESDDDVVRDVISGEEEDVPGLDEETDEEIETLDLKDPNEEDSSSDADDSADDSAESGDSGGGGGQVELSGDSLITAIATEIRENEVSAEDVKLLRQAFEIAGQEGGSIQARVQRMQSDVADLRAYTDALEEFLDENGTAQQLVEDVQSGMSSLEQAVDDVESTVAENSEELSAVSEEVGSLGDDVAEVSEEVTDVSEEVSEVSNEMTGFSDDVADVENTVDDLESDIEAIQSTVDELSEQVTDGDVAERIDDIEGEIEDLQTWQDQIKETFGG